MDDKSPSTYDADFLVWSEQQAQALRELAKNRALLPNALDLEHLIEEVEDLGRSEFHAVESYLVNIMTHLVKSACEPDSQAAAHWFDETLTFQNSMLRKHTPSMRARLDMQGLWDEARKIALRSLVRHGVTPKFEPPSKCPFVVEDFLTHDFDPTILIARLSPLV